MQPNTHFLIALTGTFGYAWFDRTKTLLFISVRDDGVGLPAGFDLSKSRGLGMRIIAALSKQLGAAISHRGDVDGTEFILMVPLQRVTE